MFALSGDIARPMTSSKTWDDAINPLIGALQRWHYMLYCQPIKALSPRPDERPYQEILVRFLEEERRLLPPGMFFPILREQGLLSLLDCWVVSQVLKLQQVSVTARPESKLYRNSINLADDTVKEPDFAQFVITQLEKWKPTADTLSFKIFAGAALEYERALNEMIAALSSRGCRFSIGSFSGSSDEMELLENLQIDAIRIDGNLVRKLLTSSSARSRIVAINDRSHELGIVTIAEQVENQETYEELSVIGIDYVQGYGVAEPVPFMGEG